MPLPLHLRTRGSIMQQAVHPHMVIAGVSPRYPSSEAPESAPGPSPASAEAVFLRAEVRRLREALEDVIALAQGGGECRHRVVQMQRRAIAALSGTDREPDAVDPSTPLR